MSADQFRKRGKEAIWQRRIIDMAKLYGWRCYHTTYSIGSDKGYPDLTCAHAQYDKLWIEVKGPNGKVAQEQIEWLAALNEGPNGLAIVAYPEDLEAVGELLAGRPVEIYDDPKDPVLRVRMIEETC
jgi:hypothetical protein